MEIDLEKGIQIISNTISLLNDDADYPYFFIVGAGVSVPEIPTASDIIKKCKEIVKKRNEAEYQEALKSINIRDKDSEKEYSAWIEKAFPNPINRSNFYKSLIKNAKISSANLMLAQILHSKIITNTIFTTNFDDKIEQALTLIGTKDYFSSENKSDNLVINVSSEEVQLVHVHGTYRFYDIANLTSEISEVSTQSGTVSSSQLLKSFLQGRAPIVLGYSGWENDVIMRSIKERLLYPVPYNYIWVCYTKKDYLALPDWLRTNRNVYFILPTDGSQQCDDSSENIYKNSSDTNDSQIPATLFLGKLIVQLKIPSPEIFVNPYQYFSSLVEETLPVSEKVLHLKHWAQRMKYHAHHESEAEKKINDLEVAIIGKNFDKICKIIVEFSQMSLDQHDIQFLSKCISDELLEDKRIIKTIPCKRDLLFAILTFVEANAATLNEIKDVSRLLYEIIRVEFKPSEYKDFIEILNKIITLTEGVTAEFPLNVSLTALGIVGFLTKDKNKKLTLFDKLLSKIPSDTKSKMIRHTQLVTLLYKCEVADDSEVLTLIESAEAICKEYSFDNIKLFLIEKKAESARKIANDEKSISWVQECLEDATKIDSEKNGFELLKITREISRIPDKRLSRIDDVDKKILALIDKVNSYNVDGNCHVALMFAEIFANIINLAESPATKLRYCQNVLSYEEKFKPENLDQECEIVKGSNSPKSCERYQDFCFRARVAICELPLILVPDEIKIVHLHYLKNVINDDPNRLAGYSSALLQAAELGDSAFYSASDLQTDYEVAVKVDNLYETAKSALNDYKFKNFSEAERKFLEILQSGDESREDSFSVMLQDLLEDAYNNLAFMVRRGEVANKNLKFEELISNASDDNIFKYVNLFLYYLTNVNFNRENVRQAYDTIRKADQEELQSIEDWWQNEEVVGTVESTLVMAVLNYIRDGVAPQIDLKNISDQYNIDELQNILQTQREEKDLCLVVTQ